MPSVNDGSAGVCGKRKIIEKEKAFKDKTLAS